MNSEDWYQNAINRALRKHVAVVLDYSLECTAARSASEEWLEKWLAGKATIDYIPVKKENK